MNFPLFLANLSGRVKRYDPQINGIVKKMMSNFINISMAVTFVSTNTIQRSTNGMKKINPASPSSETFPYFVGNSFKSLPHFWQTLELS
jgi:hypothetical protein